MSYHAGFKKTKTQIHEEYLSLVCSDHPTSKWSSCIFPSILVHKDCYWQKLIWTGEENRSYKNVGECVGVCSRKLACFLSSSPLPVLMDDSTIPSTDGRLCMHANCGSCALTISEKYIDQ